MHVRVFARDGALRILVCMRSLFSQRAIDPRTVTWSDFLQR